MVGNNYDILMKMPLHRTFRSISRTRTLGPSHTDLYPRHDPPNRFLGSPARMEEYTVEGEI